MENLEELSKKEMITVTGGNAVIRAARFLRDYLYGEALTKLLEYASDPNRRVDINHARNGGWQM